MTNISIFVQEFFPDRYEFGEKTEIYIDNEDTMDEFRQRVSFYDQANFSCMS